MAVNLVPWSISRDCLVSCLRRYGTECDIAVIDGSGGLFDDRVEAEGWSTAQLARFLMVPVILVVDAKSMGQSCAAMVKGFESFDRKVNLAGVILNRVRDTEHASMLTRALCKDGVKAECLGSIIYDETLLTQTEIRERKGETDQEYLDQLSAMATELRTRRLVEISALAKIPKSSETELKKLTNSMNSRIKIAVAKDSAFSFYYHENFMMLESAGAQLVFFSPLDDHELPEGISAIYLGGGHPELHVKRLSKNASLMASIRAFASAGGVIYAEGGGFTYLTKAIEIEHEFQPYPLVGLFPFRTVMLEEGAFHENLSVTVEMLNNCFLFPSGTRAQGLICHGSQIRQENIISLWEGGIGRKDSASFDCVYRLNREDSGFASANEGYCKESVLGSYVHLQFASDRRLAPAFVKRCKEVNLPKVKEAVKQALINFNIQIVKKAGSHGGLSYLNTSQMSPVFDSPKPSPVGFKSEKMKVPVYSCLEAKPTRFPYSKTQKGFQFKQDYPTTKIQKPVNLEKTEINTQEARPPLGGGNIKIVGLSSTGVEMICALGLQTSLIGITNLCKFPEEIQTGRRVVATTKFEASHLDDSRLELKLKDFWCRQESAFVLDEEYLRNQAPGLVIVEDGGDPGRETIEQIFQTRKNSFTGLCPSPTTKILSHKCHHLSEILEFMLEIAQAAGVEDSAASVVDQLRFRIGRIGSLIAPDFPVERVLVLTCLNPLMIGGFWIPEMVALAGGENLGAKAGHPHQRVTWEELKNLEPEILILAAASWEETKQELTELASLPGWWAMPAMKTGQVYVCNPGLFTMAGPRLVDGIELLARILHPSSAGQYGKQGMAWSCTLRGGKRCRPCHLYRQFCTLL